VTAITLTIVLQNGVAIAELLKVLHIPGACTLSPHTYTLLNKSASVGSIAIDAEGVGLYIESVEHNNITIIVEDTGGCGNRVSARIENGVLKVRAGTRGCCSIKIRLPHKHYNVSLDLSATALKIKGLIIDKLALTASTSLVKVLDSSIGAADIQVTASSMKFYNTDIREKLTISATASSVKLAPSNQGASIVLQGASASSISNSCPEAQTPAILVSGSASSIRISCAGIG